MDRKKWARKEGRKERRNALGSGCIWIWISYSLVEYLVANAVSAAIDRNIMLPIPPSYPENQLWPQRPFPQHLRKDLGFTCPNGSNQSRAKGTSPEPHTARGSSPHSRGESRWPLVSESTHHLSFSQQKSVPSSLLPSAYGHCAFFSWTVVSKVPWDSGMKNSPWPSELTLSFLFTPDSALDRILVKSRSWFISRNVNKAFHA